MTGISSFVCMMESFRSLQLTSGDVRACLLPVLIPMSTPDAGVYTRPDASWFTRGLTRVNQNPPQLVRLSFWARHLSGHIKPEKLLDLNSETPIQPSQGLFEIFRNIGIFKMDLIHFLNPFWNFYHGTNTQARPKKESCRGEVSVWWVFSWERATQGHDPKGVPKPQENTQIQAPPLA